MKLSSVFEDLEQRLPMVDDWVYERSAGRE